MVARSGSGEIQVKEQQLEAWEEKLGQRAQSLAESMRLLQQRRAQVTPQLKQLEAQGGTVPPAAQELLAADPTLASPQVATERTQAEEARRAAVDARQRAAQAWEQEIARQATALNTVIQGLQQLQQQVARELAELEAKRTAQAESDAQSEPVKLVRAKSKGAAVIPTASEPLPPPRSGPEARIHNRAKLRVQVDFESDHNFFTGFSSDISEGGLFVATVNIQPLGSPVEVAFALPTGEQIMARGVVKWIREASDRDMSTHPGMGIQFEQLADDAREAVHGFITQRDPIFYDE
jgi:uncharacterized protein (TIGR02266 family)